ncbi:MAG: DUF1997 domain-containing protein [Thermosynechococcaceae cyanobacterium MS004]|nr:DUF1997 domain-containing protein [Thermosynechococcaceae cyanobacterium MS004]
MQSNYAQQLSQEAWRELSDERDNPSSAPSCPSPAEAAFTQFRSHFVGNMALKSDAETVKQYLDAHNGWFCRCAHPMSVEPVGTDGYQLIVGRYGSLGYEIEPKIGLRLLPPDDQGVYRIETIPESPDAELMYQVDFKAALRLVDSPASDDAIALTQVEWTLDLDVSLLFPRFIRRLPQSLIKATGDRLLQQIVRQVSRRLTAKVQDDFHASLQVP